MSVSQSTFVATILRERTTAAAVAPVRVSKGHKHGGKKEATLTKLSTISPVVRTPEGGRGEFGRDGNDEGDGGEPAHAGAHGAAAQAPVGDAGPQGRRADRVRPAVGGALTDGSQALQERVQRQFPSFTLVLDLVHATEYFWKAANALCGEDHPRRTGWVKARTLRLLHSQGTGAVADLHHLAKASSCPQRAPCSSKAKHTHIKTSEWMSVCRSSVSPISITSGASAGTKEAVA